MGLKSRAPSNLQRLRDIIFAWPETSEKLSHGAPTFWGGKKTFASLHDGHYDEGRPGVWIKVPEGLQADLVAQDASRFYRPKYLGPSGWVGVRILSGDRWDQIEALLLLGYRSVAPKRCLAALAEV